MKRLKLLFVFVCLALYACDYNAVQNANTTKPVEPGISAEDIDVSFDGGILRVTTTDDDLQKNMKINYTIGKKTGSSVMNCYGMAEFDILDQVIEAVYNAKTMNSAINSIDISVSINDSPYVNKKITAKPFTGTNKKATISGKCMPISNSVSDETLSSAIKRWIFRNEKTYNEQIVESIGNTIKSFQSSENIWRPTTNELIPVVKDLKGLAYNVTTDIKADYYYLFATNNQADLDEFIEEVATSNYPQSSKSTKSLSAFRKNMAGGLLGLFFIGLNSDWSKTIMPVGLLVVDNIAPICNTDNDYSDPYRYRFGSSLYENDITLPKYNIKIVADDDVVPMYRGGLTLKTNMFHGDAAQFEVSFYGDVESISIKREIHRDYQRYFMKPETKTIPLDGILSPYHFTYTLDLGLGDNFIPITVKDTRGNVTSFNYKITMVQNKKDNPDINIDNNITIWN